MKSAYLLDVKSAIAKALTLLDRNRSSRTYGCFDRNYWHYKIKDFPSGMSQELVLALAQVYAWELEENPYFGQEPIRRYAEAGIDFARASSRADGSTDDYYPYERALGAAVFSLHAMTETYELLGLERPDLLAFFEARADWVMASEESGHLANHHAIAALALWNTHRLTGKDRFRRGAAQKIEHVLALQTEEGWYQEYEGCSVGYLTVSIDFLSQYYRKTGDAAVRRSLERAVGFFSRIQHPDGTVGGDYDSRNVTIFHPQGFELLAPENESARRIANSYLRARQAGLLAAVTDDYIFGHSLVSNLGAYRACAERDFSCLNEKRGTGSTYYRRSGFYVYEQGEYWGVFNLYKGATGKVYRDGRLVYADGGAVASSPETKAVSGVLDPTARITVEESGFRVSKALTRYRPPQATIYNVLIFRLALLVLGPFSWSSRLIRILLQRKMIVGKRRLSATFTRTLTLEGGSPRIRSEIAGWDTGGSAYLASELVPIYTAVAECFQLDSLQVGERALRSEGGSLVHEETL